MENQTVNTTAKIAISGSAEDALSRALERVNSGFDGGRVTKADLASWFILESSSSLAEDTIDNIRKAHFNQVVYLESLVKKLKSSGRDNLGVEEMATLQAMLGQPSSKKRPRGAKAEGDSSHD